MDVLGPGGMATSDIVASDMARNSRMKRMRSHEKLQIGLFILILIRPRAGDIKAPCKSYHSFVMFVHHSI